MTKIWIALCLLAAVTVGCSQSHTAPEERQSSTATATASPTAEQPADAATITISDMSFGQPVTVAPGTTVTVRNNDSVEHSVTSQTAGQFDVHVDGTQTGTFTAPAQPGEYAFYCVYHPSMKGKLIVR